MNLPKIKMTVPLFFMNSDGFHGPQISLSFMRSSHVTLSIKMFEFRFIDVSIINTL
jgi:hypothetical protein